MDQVSRQARALEQGFNTKLFHGTQAPPPNIIDRAEASLSGGEFNQFNWGTHAGTRQAAEDRIRSADLGGGVPPSFGEIGAIDALEDARIFPVRAKGEFLKINDLGSRWGPADLLEEAKRVGAITSEEASSALMRAANVERAGGDFLDAGKAEVTRLLERKGFSGVQYENVVEDISSTSFMIFDPANLRSEFARFDPSNIGTEGMLGGLAAVLAGAAVARQQQER